MPIAYGSRAFTETEHRYSQIEKEMLAIVFSLETLHQYTYGRPVKVFSDHKPLEMKLKKPLTATSRRVQGMRMRLQIYDTEVSYQPGPTMHIADLLSRSYIPTMPDPTSVEFDQINMARFLPISYEMSAIKPATATDETLRLMKKKAFSTVGLIINNRHLCKSMHAYFSTRDELSVQDELIFRGEQVVIPTKLHPYIKQKFIHNTWGQNRVYDEPENAFSGQV